MWLLAEKGHLDEAVAACRRASQLKPDDGYAHYDLGLSCIAWVASTRRWPPFAGPSS